MKVENKNYLLFNHIDKLIEQGKLENKKIVLFGLNISSYATKNYLERNGYSVYAYIDNNPNKIFEANMMFEDVLPRHLQSLDYETIQNRCIRAYRPEELLGHYQEDIVILIASKYYPSMCEQLKSLGFQEGHSIFKTLDFYGIDDILKEDESISSVMMELSNAEIREIQLQLVQYLQKICEENHLRYYMTGGTLLGAVRHKGYIPWDDDIDMTMPMPDYLKLLDIIFKDNQYDVFSMYHAPEQCYHFFAKLIDRNTTMKLWEYPFYITGGVGIDIFPLIGLPDRMDEIQPFFSKIRHLNSMYSDSYMEFEDTDAMKERRQKLREEVLAMMEQYNWDDCQQSGYILSKYWEKDIMPRSIYGDQIELPFEDLSLPAPIGYAQYLERIFGDYMKLPSEKEQYVTHNYRVYR